MEGPLETRGGWSLALTSNWKLRNYRYDKTSRILHSHNRRGELKSSYQILPDSKIEPIEVDSKYAFKICLEEKGTEDKK